MSQIAEIRAEVRRLSEQQSSDFQFTMMALKNMGERFQVETAELGRRIEGLGREMQEGFNQLAGRMKLQEQRVGAVLQAVDSALAVYEDHEERIQALEQKNDSAA